MRATYRNMSLYGTIKGQNEAQLARMWYDMGMDPYEDVAPEDFEPLGIPTDQEGNEMEAEFERLEHEHADDQLEMEELEMEEFEIDDDVDTRDEPYEGRERLWREDFHSDG